MSDERKKRIYEQLSRVSKALASASRLELLDLLTQGERSVEDLATETRLTVANASQHLQQLLGAHLVETRKAGNRVLYRVAAISVERLWQAVRDVAEEQLADLDQVAKDYLLGRDEFEPIGRDELARRIEGGEIMLVDVRPRREFEAQHIKGAISVPLEELETFSQEAPRDKQIVAYCRGPYCVYALQAVALLRERGLPAARSESGVAEWRLAGLPVETGMPVRERTDA